MPLLFATVFSEEKSQQYQKRNMLCSDAKCILSGAIKFLWLKQHCECVLFQTITETKSLKPLY